jgi:hypothetical protein
MMKGFHKDFFEDPLNEYRGNLHVHSTHSDGSGSVRDIAGSAQRAGLDFLILNDHAHMAGSGYLGEEGLHGKVAVLTGLEIGKRFHHYLAFGLRSLPDPLPESPQQVIDYVRSGGGLGFIAHPFEKGMPFMEKSRAYTWNDLEVEGFTGICIWNFSSRWKERVKTIFHSLPLLVLKNETLKGPSSRTLGFWDTCCQTGRVVAIGGSDAHGTIFKAGPFKFTPLGYDFLLNTINIHILLKDRMPRSLDMIKRSIYGAMASGSLFIANDGIESSDGFRFFFQGKRGLFLSMGDEAPFEKGELFIKSPRFSRIRLIKDGSLRGVWDGKKVGLEIDEAGVYRVEASLSKGLFGWCPWIFSNPIYLR